MSQIHDEIKESLRQYLSGSLNREIKDKAESHLKECKDCRDELALISELVKVEVPDPGDLFWNTLPKKIRITAEEQKTNRFSFRTLFFKPLPIAAIIVAMSLLVLSNIRTKNVPAEIFVKDPLSASVVDYSGLREEDIPAIDSKLAIAEDYFPSEYISGNSYHREIASLGPKELERLYEVLNKQEEKGG